MKSGSISLISMAVVAALFFGTVAVSAQNMPESNASATTSESDMLFTLLQIQADVQGNLNGMDSDVANAAQNLSATGLEGAAARGVLSKLLDTNLNLTEAVTVSKDGKIIVAECKGCRGGEGANISSQEHIAHILKAKTPALSGEFLTVEGYNATALAYPVFSPQGEFLGGISATFEPEKVMKPLVAPRLNGTDYTFWIMQTDGQDIYDVDAGQIGKNILKDPLYKPFTSLLALVQKMVAERSGRGSYEFQATSGNKTVVTKEVYWTAAGLYGRDWRLAIARITG